MGELDLSSLAGAAAAWLRGRRWFAGQGRPLAGVHLDWAASLPPADPPEPSGLPEPAGPGAARVGGGAGPLLVHTALQVRYEDGGAECYHVPLGLTRPDDPVVADGDLQGEAVVLGEVRADGRGLLAYDALADERLRLRLLGQIAAGANGDRLRCHPHTDPARLRAARSRLLTAEQSNSSVVYDDTLILKLFRRLEGGVNPELELTAALAGHGFTAVAAPLGWMETTDQTTLAVVQPFYRDAVEGWQLAVERAAAWVAGDARAGFAADAHALGAVTAQLHAALAAALPTTRASADELAADRARRGREVEEVLAVAPQLAGLRERMLAVFEAAADAAAHARLQRVHGDYHLGQVLRTPGGWVVLDFEGEPRRPLAARRRPASPLRDVAGMLRSFDYAAFHQLVASASSADPGSSEDGRAPAPGDAGEDDAAERAEAWAIRARRAFLDGYAQPQQATSGGAGAPAGLEGPDRDRTDAASLLRAFELEKALYEVMYEARYRPGWISIPVGGVERLLR